MLTGCGDDGGSPPDGGGDETCATNADCDDGVFCNGEEICDPTVGSADGCAPAVNPACLASQTCDETTDECLSDCDVEADADSDGVDSVTCGGLDCDDSDSNRYPGNTEICDRENHDEDCDPTTFGIRDLDGDGEPDAACCNVDDDESLVCGSDCDDSRASVSPVVSESCDGRDNDCDGMVDEEVLTTYTIDADDDGFGSNADDAATMVACERPDGYREDATDCDDEASAVNPGNAEVCDEVGVDENCSGTVNEDCACSVPESRGCDVSGAMGLCASGVQICDGATGTFGSCSIEPQPEVCNGADEDCDGMIDDGVTVACYQDMDRDGFAPDGAMREDICPAPDGSCPGARTSLAPSVNSDCNDGLPNVNPTGSEVCNGLDDDCNGATDEDLTVECYPDGDGDGWASMGAPVVDRCPEPTRPDTMGCPVGFTHRNPTSVGADCNDSDPAVKPGVNDRCDNMIDDNCDGTINESCACSAGDPDIMCDEPGACAAGSRSCDTALGEYGECSVSPIMEICNDQDDDCDGTVDNGFECSGSTSFTCTHPVCGSTGSQTCSSCTLGACVAAEICNGCDDDNDGTPDDGPSFVCVQGQTTSCTTACGTTGTGTCNSTCTGADSCAAAGETCNYCDDNGDGFVGDESSLAGTTREWAPLCTTLDALDRGCSPDFGLQELILYDGDCGDFLCDWGIARHTGSRSRVGFGTVTMVAEMEVDTSASSPNGGWAFLIEQSGNITLGTSAGWMGYSRSSIRNGLAFEWRFNGTGPDTITVRRLDGTSTAPTLGFAATVTDTAYRVDGPITSRLQRIHVTYQPEIDNTSTREERLRIRTCPTCPVLLDLTPSDFGTNAVLLNELPVGASFTIGASAESTNTDEMRWKIGGMIAAGGTIRDTYIRSEELCSCSISGGSCDI